MQHCDVGIRSFFPADEDPAKSIHPTARALDDPAASSEASLLLDCLRFFAATPELFKRIDRWTHSAAGSARIQS
jgi:hypothetical protein